MNNSRRFFSSKSKSQSKNFRVKRRTRGIAISILSIVGIIAGAYILSLVFSLGWFSITNVQISGIDQEKINPIYSAVMEKLQGKYLGFFSKSNIAIYPHRDIVDMIKISYPEVETVTVERDGLHTIVVKINEKNPEALVCTTLPDFNGNELVLDDPGSCYFVDSTGLIFKKAPSFSGTIYNRYYVPNLSTNGDEASSTVLINTQATSTEEFIAIQQLYNSVKKSSIIADAVLMKDGGEYELYIRNPGMSSSTAVVYFNTISSTTEQLSNFISFWNHTLKTARTKKETVEFDYIDVRYSPNVYHRFTK